MIKMIDFTFSGLGVGADGRLTADETDPAPLP